MALTEPVFPIGTLAGDSAMDEANDALRVNIVAGTPSGTTQVDVTDEPTRDLGKVDVVSLDQYTPVSGRLPIDGSGVTQPVSAASLPLPTGAATSANQLPNSHDVTVDNAGAGAAVNVQDGGNVLSVDDAASSLTVDAPVGTPVAARLSDGAAFLTTTGGRLAVDPSGVTSPVSIAATVQVDVTDKAARDLGKVDVASLDQYSPVSGRLPVDGSGVTQPVSISATVNTAVLSINGEDTIANGQVTVSTTAATVVAARAGRRSLLIVNHGTTDVYLGVATVTTANGVLLKGTAGSSISIPTTALVQGIVGSGTQLVSYIEVF